MMAVLARGVRELLKDETDRDRREAFLADIEAYTAHLATGGEPDEELAERIADIEAAVARGYGPYAERVADRTYWNDVLPIEASRLRVVGWEGLDGPCETGPEGLTDAALARVPPDHLEAVGLKALSLFGPTEDEAKN